ncbi:MAG TPA: hypothetical protein PK496_07590 [Bacteroidales bacterium]|nr:hypothetical protein [Bacteroidales bacterium]
MTSQGYEELKNLNNKIDILIQRYRALEEENKNLRTLNENLEKMLREREDELKELEKKYEIIKLTGALLGESEYGLEAKKKISELVREIDKCIALLDK